MLALKAPLKLFCEEMAGKINIWLQIKIPQQLADAEFPSSPSPQPEILFLIMICSKGTVNIVACGPVILGILVTASA